MQNFLIQRITENDDYVEIQSDLPVIYSDDMTLPEFLAFLIQHGYHIELGYRGIYYFAIKTVQTKKIENHPYSPNQKAYSKIFVVIYLSDTDKLLPKIVNISIDLKFNPAPYTTRNGFQAAYTPNENSQEIIPKSVINFFLGIEQELPKIENVSTWEQLENVAYDLWLKYHEFPIKLGS
jgi:hypothetical protein